jgi:hypothetical protein
VHKFVDKGQFGFFYFKLVCLPKTKRVETPTYTSRNRYQNEKEKNCTSNKRFFMEQREYSLSLEISSFCVEFWISRFPSGCFPD